MNQSTSLLSVFWNKPAGKKILLIQIFCMLSFAGLANFILPFKVYARFLGEINSESARNPQGVDWNIVDEISRSVKNVSRVSLFDFKCLVQATVGKLFLARKKIDSTIYFGVKKDESQKLKAHAWLRVGPKIVLGGEVADQYNVVSMFS